MSNFKTIAKFAFILLTFFFASSAFAQATRTWVSGVGDDANPCSRTAPCKTFAGAISKTAPNGVINALDPAGYGAVTITKPITIEAIGLEAGVLVSGSNGIIVNAGASDTVILRGLALVGLGTGLDGVNVIQAGKVIIENCTIQDFTNDGVNFHVAGAGAQLQMRNVTMSKIGNAGVQLVGSDTSSATLDAVHLLQSKGGVIAQNGSLSIKDSVISGNTVYGVSAAAGAVTLKVNIDSTTISDNTGTGVKAAGSAAQIYLSRSTLTNNGTGYSVGTGTIYSFGDNRIAGNTSNSGSLTAVAQQ